MKSKFSVEKYFERYALPFVFFTMIIVFTIMSPIFFTMNSFVNILVTAAPQGIAVIGMAIVILQGGIDLSAGSSMYLGAIICSLIVGHGHGPLVFIVLALSVGAIVGLINGLIITKFKVIPFIATYGMMMLVRGVALTMSGQKNIIFSDPVSQVLCSQRLIGIPIVVYIFGLVLMLTYFVLNFTPYGRQLYAIGNSERSAVKIGIKVQRIRLGSYIICGALASLCGLLTGAQSGAFNPSLGSGKEFVFIAAAVLGGVSLSGGKCKVFPHLLIGILIITAIEVGLVMNSANPYLYQIVRGAMIAIAVVIDSIKYKGALR